MRHNLFYIFLLAIIFAGCADKQVLVNKTGNCKLELYKDSTYTFTYPAFIGGKRHENGTYSRLSNAILLKRIVQNTYDNVINCYSGYYFHPDTLQFITFD